MSRGGDVVLVISDLGPGGAQRVVSLLAGALAARGHAVCVATFDDGGRDHFRLPPGVRREVVGGLAPSSGLVAAVVGNLGRIRRLRRTLRGCGARTVVSFIAVTNILAVLASVAAPWRLVISERNDPARQRLGRPWDALRRRLYRHADMVTANSEAAIATLRDSVPAERLALVRNPLSLERFGPAAGGRKPVVLAVGRLAEQKAFDVLIDAFAAIAPGHPEWRLGIAGDGPLRGALATRAERHGIAERVDWLGTVEDCAPLYGEASVFALPSRHEGVPNALLEAMAAECACVVSDASGGPLEYVRDGESGLVVPVDDTAALARALERLIGDAGLRAALGRTARARVEANAVDAVVDGWSALLGLGTAPS